MPGYRVVSLFNDHLGGSTRDSPLRPGAEERAQAHIPMMDGYHSGDELVRSSIELAVEAATPEAACEETFRQLNMDERPNGQYERSLSVGDLIAVYASGGDELVGIYAVESLGVRRLGEREQAAVSIPDSASAAS